MQTLIETLNLYNNAFDALCEAQNLVEQLETEASRILDNNTEPITVPTVGDVDRNITTPDDIKQLHLGTVIRIGGTEYMRAGYPSVLWTDCLGRELSYREVFRRMLDDADECHIIHEGN